MEPTEFIITDTDELIVPNSGLALIGKLLAATKIAKRADSLALPRKPRPEVLHSDVLLAMIGLLCLGKSDFGDITPFYENPFFAKALGLRTVASEPTLRQRMELFEDLPQSFLCKESALMVRRHAPSITRCFKDWVALDVDVSPFDNSNTKKEGIGCTYKLTDGFAPIFAYLAEEGYLVHQEFREGSQHCQKGTPEFLKQAIDYARMISDAKLLVRLDSGNDAENTLETLRRQKVDFIIKRNLRKEGRDEWLETAQAFGEWRHPREGKTVYIGDTHRQCGEHTWRVVFDITERTTDRDEQQLMFPEITISTYWTSLGPRQATPDEVIELYRKHGTSEQFHSEIKTDLDLERLPSGRFTVNALVLTCGMVAYNALRLIGQNVLKVNNTLPPEEKMPLRKKVKRRRLRSIIQDIMYFAGRLVKHARRWHLSLPLINRWRGVFKAAYDGISQRNRRRTI